MVRTTFARFRESTRQYGTEVLILVLLALTLGAVAFQDRLLTRTIILTPQSHWSPNGYTDAEMHGTSTVRPVPGEPLSWRCELKPAFAYPYCGYEFVVDPAHTARGIDLSDYETLTLDLGYDGPSDGLIVYLKNYDRRYSTPGIGVSNKFNRIDFRGRRGAFETILHLRDVRVADWWLASHNLPTALAAPQLDNVVSIAVQTGEGAKPGVYHFHLRSLTLRRTIVSQSQFYLALLAFWVAILLLFLGSRVVGQRRAWEERLAERQRVEAALRESNERAYRMLDRLPQIIFEIDPQGQFTYLSPQWEDFTGRDRVDDLGKGWVGAVEPGDVQRVGEIWQASVESETLYEAELRIRHRDGSYRWLFARAFPDRDEQGQVVRWLGTCIDVHDRVMVQDALRESEALNRSILKATPDSVVLLDRQGRIIDTNDAADRSHAANGFPIGDAWAAWFHSADYARVQSALATAREGEVGRCTVRDAIRGDRWWDVLVAPLQGPDGGHAKLVSIARDVTEQKQAEEHAYWIANHDGLTGLPNRNLMQQKLDRAVLDAFETGTKFALLLVDVDEFKRVNDTAGHDGGDALLCAFAARLRGAIRADDAVFRLGGDEFALLLTGAASARDVHLFVDALYEELREPCVHGGRMLDLKASMGAALFPVHGSSRSELMKNADIALYAAKAAGRSQLKVFAPAMRNEVQKRGSMLALARAALAESRVVPYYQPQIHLRTGAVIGFEALLRWRHPQRGLQLPGAIEAAFEDSNLASEISDAIIDRAIADIARWRERGLAFGHVSINAAAAEFRRENFAESLLERLATAGVPPQAIQLEVTETVFIGRGAEYVERALKLLSGAGMKIALDDFGTGFASLSHLQQFPVDTIKIDRRFVAGLGGRTGNHAIINAVLGLGRSLGMEVVAEGIETQQQEQALLRLGCEYGQGFLYSRAVPARLVPSLVDRQAPDNSAAAA